MSKISEEGYLFIHSGILEKSQIEACFFSSIKYLSENYDKEFESCKIEINVVTNKNNEKFGHTYGWVSDKRFYYALLGKNFDGSERFTYSPDEDWVEPEEDFDSAMQEVSGNWGEEDEIEESYNRPMKKVPMEPIITLPAIKYTDSQKEKISDKSEYGFLEVYEVKLTKKPEKLNSIFSNNIPEWVDEDILYNYFKKYSKDPITYIDKKTKKKFQYPMVKIKERRDSQRYCVIYFSPIDINTASFLINMIKRVTFTKENKSEILFFSQNKSCKN